MRELTVRRFKQEDADFIANHIQRNFLEVNIKDYSLQEMQYLTNIYNPQKVMDIANYAHMYVACVKDMIVGCGAISSFWGKLDESILLTIFVLPELQGKGIGRKIIETLESDEYFLRAKRVEIPSSITGCEFYRKMGYDFKNGIKELDDEKHFRLEKFR